MVFNVGKYIINHFSHRQRAVQLFGLILGVDFRGQSRCAIQFLFRGRSERWCKQIPDR